MALQGQSLGETIGVVKYTDARNSHISQNVFFQYALQQESNGREPQERVISWTNATQLPDPQRLTWTESASSSQKDGTPRTGAACKGVIHSAVGMVGSDTGKLTLALELPKLSSRPDIHRKCLMNPALNFGTHRNTNSKFVSKHKLSRVGLRLDSYLPRSISQMRMK